MRRRPLRPAHLLPVLVAAVTPSFAVETIVGPSVRAERRTVESQELTGTYVPTTAGRLADTRLASCTCTRLDSSTIRVAVTGRAGVPVEAIAAHLTITVADITAPLHVTAWPAGEARPTTSVLNATPRDIAAATSIPLALGENGSIDVAVSAGAAVVVDVAGAWVPGDPLRSGGRFQLLPRTRLTVPVVAGVPTTVRAPTPVAATALAASFEVEGGGPAGFVAAWPSGTSWPGTSLLNHQGSRRRSTAIVPVGADGSISIMSSTDVVVTVDIIGAMVDTPGPDGMLVLAVPSRVLDTRSDRGLPWAAAGQMPAAGTVVRHRVGATGGIAVLVVTTVGGDPGALTATTGGVVHLRDGSDARADAAYVQVEGDGTVGYVIEGRTHVVADVVARFTGPMAQPASTPNLTVLPHPPWTAARRWGTPCERRLLAHLDRHMPSHLRWVLPYVEVRVSSSLPVVGTAAFANYRYLQPRGFSVPSVGAVSGPMTVLVGSSECNGSDREVYIVTHEAVGHLVDSLFDDIDGWPRRGGRPSGLAFNGLSPMMPAFITVPARRAVELFADCVTVVLGTAIGTHYTECTDEGWRTETEAVLAYDALHLRALPLLCAVHQVLDRPLPFDATLLGGRIAAGDAPTTVPAGSSISTCTVAVLSAFGELWGTTDDVVILATPDGSLYRPVVTGVMARYG